MNWKEGFRQPGVPAALGAALLFRNNLLLYGVGGLIAPFIGIKMIDMILVGFGLS